LNSLEEIDLHLGTNMEIYERTEQNGFLVLRYGSRYLLVAVLAASKDEEQIRALLKRMEQLELYRHYGYLASP